MALTKAEMAEHLVDKLGLNKKEAKDLVEAFFEEIKQALEDGTQVKLSGFGNFDYWAERETNNTKVKPTVRSIEETLSAFKPTNRGAHKVMCMGPADEIAKIYASLIDSYEYDLHIYKSKDTYLEIANKLISKKSGIFVGFSVGKSAFKRNNGWSE